MLSHPCGGKHCHSTGLGHGLSQTPGGLGSDSESASEIRIHSFAATACNPVMSAMWEKMQRENQNRTPSLLSRSFRGLGLESSAAAAPGPVYPVSTVYSAFLGPVHLRLPMYVPNRTAALSIDVPGLKQAPHSIRVHLLDAQRYNLQPDLMYDVGQMAQAAPFALDLAQNKQAYHDSLVLRAALAQKDGESEKAQVWLRKANLAAVPATLLRNRRAVILQWLQKVLALLAPVDILFGLQEFLRFLDARLNVSGLGQPCLVAVCNVPELDNAFFGGGYMVFGNGKTQFYPLASLDVIGHEMGHGVIQSLSPLDYQGHSGALNESFADVIGTCFEFFVQNKFNRNESKEDDLTDMGAADYEIGEDLDVQGKYLRNMAEPEKAAFPQPSSVKGRYYVDPASDFDYGGVHVNSGIPNVLFYRLSRQKGRVRAMRVFFDVLRNGKMPADCTFATFAEKLLLSAQKFKCGLACRKLLLETKMLDRLPRPPRPVPPPAVRGLHSDTAGIILRSQPNYKGSKEWVPESLSMGQEKQDL